MEIKLINEALFKENSPIKEDTIISKFVPYIGIAQKMYIEKILGQALTDELKYQIKEASNGGADITPANQALILQIAPALSFYAVYQGIPFHWASIVNKGVTVRDSENSKAIDIKDISQLRRWLRDDAEELARHLTDYLCRCRDSYPLWHPAYGCSCGCDDECTDNVGTDKSPFDTGIFIPKRC